MSVPKSRKTQCITYMGHLTSIRCIEKSKDWGLNFVFVVLYVASCYIAASVLCNGINTEVSPNGVTVVFSMSISVVCIVFAGWPIAIFLLVTWCWHRLSQLHRDEGKKTSSVPEIALIDIISCQNSMKWFDWVRSGQKYSIIIFMQQSWVDQLCIS